jgi:hypothetical protein
LNHLSLSLSPSLSLSLSLSLTLSHSVSLSLTLSPLFTFILKFDWQCRARIQWGSKM